MLIVEDDRYFTEVDKVNHRKIASHDVIYYSSNCSYHWYLMIALIVLLNTFNLLHLKDVLGFHCHLIIGLFILIFKHVLVHFFIEDRDFYEITGEDDEYLYVKYSDVNNIDYRNSMKPRFDWMTIIKVILHYFMYILMSYYLSFFITQFHIFNEIIISFILTLAMLISSYLSFDDDYSDIHYYLNFSLVCLISLLVVHFSLMNDFFSILLFVFLLCMMFYILNKIDCKLLFKICILFLCIFYHYHHIHYYQNEPYFKINNGTYY